MIVEVHGGTYAMRRDLEHAAKWAGDYLLGTRLTDKCFLELQILPGPKKEEKHQTRAFCIWTDTGDRSREFLIEILDHMNMNLTLKVLMHEMIHLQQYAKGKLKNLQKGIYWENKLVPPGLRYWRCPWEKEAYAREWDVYQEYMKSIYL